MTVSCIIPAFNEARNIAGVLREVKRVGAIDEIIVVDDGSSDKTYDAARSEGVAVIRHTANKGKGAAIKSGLSVATGDVIVFLDADLTNITAKKVGLLVSGIKKGLADVVIGTFNFNCYQTFTEVVYRPLMNLLFPEVLLKINQGLLSGQRAFRRGVLDKLHLRDDFGFETAMNIELSFLKPEPRIRFVDLGNINPVNKGCQESMRVIADTILDYARKYGRIGRLGDSSIKHVSGILYKAVSGAVR